MFKHLFKLIWNKKKQNFLLMSEMLVSFLVIFAVFTLMVYYYTNYKKPIGLDYENLWLVSYNNTNPTKSTDSLNLYYENLRQEMKAMPRQLRAAREAENVAVREHIDLSCRHARARVRSALRARRTRTGNALRTRGRRGAPQRVRSGWQYRRSDGLARGHDGDEVCRHRQAHRAD